MVESALVAAAVLIVVVIGAASLTSRRVPETRPRNQEYFDAEFLRLTVPLKTQPVTGALEAVRRLGGSVGSLCAIDPGIDPQEVRIRSPYGTLRVHLPRTGDVGKLLEMQRDLLGSEGSYLIASLPEGTSLVVSTANRRVTVRAEILP